MNSFMANIVSAAAARGGLLARWPTFKIVAVAISLLFLIAVIELIRRNKLKEKYAILWLFSAVVLLLFSSWIGLLNWTSKLLGIDYPPSLLFLMAFVFLLFIVFHFSIVISKESNRTKTLTQKTGLLEHKIRELEKRLESKEKD